MTAHLLPQPLMYSVSSNSNLHHSQPQESKAHSIHEQDSNQQALELIHNHIQGQVEQALSQPDVDQSFQSTHPQHLTSQSKPASLDPCTSDNPDSSIAKGIDAICNHHQPAPSSFKSTMTMYHHPTASSSHQLQQQLRQQYLHQHSVEPVGKARAPAAVKSSTCLALGSSSTLASSSSDLFAPTVYPSPVHLDANIFTSPEWLPAPVHGHKASVEVEFSQKFDNVKQRPAYTSTPPPTPHAICLDLDEDQPYGNGDEALFDFTSQTSTRVPSASPLLSPPSEVSDCNDWPSLFITSPITERTNEHTDDESILTDRQRSSTTSALVAAAGPAFSVARLRRSSFTAATPIPTSLLATANSRNKDTMDLAVQPGSGRVGACAKSLPSFSQPHVLASMRMLPRAAKPLQFPLLRAPLQMDVIDMGCAPQSMNNQQMTVSGSAHGSSTRGRCEGSSSSGDGGASGLRRSVSGPLRKKSRAASPMRNFILSGHSLDVL